MPFLGKRSLLNLSDADWSLQKIVQRAITITDFSVIQCARGEDEQNLKFEQGLSKVKYPDSAHNVEPAQGIDFIPCPFVGWEDKASFYTVRSAFAEALRQLKEEGEVPTNYELEFGYDWGWDLGHINRKNWKMFI